MDAVIIPELFKGNQLEEVRYWLDYETPHNNDGTWLESPFRTSKVKMCKELDMLHVSLIDKARDIFSVHNLLPTFSTINWYEDTTDIRKHFDDGPVEYTIMFNYFSETPLEIIYGKEKIVLDNEEAIAYNGAEFEHYRNNNGSISIGLYFNFAQPNNYHFALGNYTNGGIEFPSQRHVDEVDVNWL